MEFPGVTEENHEERSQAIGPLGRHLKQWCLNLLGKNAVQNYVW